MKPIEQAFLADILKSPNDDAPRLIYADWLEENDQPERAEFIRVQCEIARTHCSSQPPCKLFNEGLPGEAQGWCMECCRLYALRRREWRLAKGTNKLHASIGTTSEWIFRRGFGEEITIRLADWLRHGPALVRVAPLRVVRLSDWQPRLLTTTGGMVVWVFDLAWIFSYPKEFDDTVRMHHGSEADALAVMSRSCLEYARGQNTKIVPTSGVR